LPLTELIRLTSELKCGLRLHVTKINNSGKSPCFAFLCLTNYASHFFFATMKKIIVCASSIKQPTHSFETKLAHPNLLNLAASFPDTSSLVASYNRVEPSCLVSSSPRFDMRKVMPEKAKELDRNWWSGGIFCRLSQCLMQNLGEDGLAKMTELVVSNI
jgi:hypothetical protein